jgi:hypothetical protein
VTCNQVNTTRDLCYVPYVFEGKSGNNVYQIDKISISGKDAVKVATKEYIGVDEDDEYLVFGKTGKILILSVQIDGNIEKILGSFKFTN